MKKRYPFLPKTWLRFGLAAAFATAFSLNLQAQTAPAKLWDKTFGGSSYETLSTIKQTTDGGYILGGTSGSGISGDKSQNSKGDWDYWIVKTDASGNKAWDKTFGGSNFENLYTMQQTTDGGYILGGSSESGISGDKSNLSKGGFDYWIVKLDAAGNKIWDKTFGGDEEDRLIFLQQTSDGGYILGGQSASGISGDKTQALKGIFGTYDYWVIKLDTNGNLLWDKTLGGSDYDLLNTLQQTLDGGYILGGHSGSDIGGDKSQACQGIYDYWIVKLDANGNKTWDKTFGGNNYDLLYSLCQTADGGYILGGYSNSGSSSDKSQATKGGYDYWVVKLDAIGNKLWDKTIGGTDNDHLFSIQQTSDGNYILGGISNTGINGDKSEASKGGYDYWVVKLDATGNKIWDKTLGGISSDQLRTLQKTSDGGLVLGGATDSGVGGDKTQASIGGSDYWIIKLAADVLGIKEPEASFNLSISPNPNQGKFNLQLSNLTAPKAAVTVSDLLGRVVLRKEIQATNNQISEELSLPDAKGIYLLQLNVGEQIINRKIVVE